MSVSSDQAAGQLDWVSMCVIRSKEDEIKHSNVDVKPPLDRPATVPWPSLWSKVAVPHNSVILLLLVVFHVQLNY